MSISSSVYPFAVFFRPPVFPFFTLAATGQSTTTTPSASAPSTQPLYYLPPPLFVLEGPVFAVASPPAPGTFMTRAGRAAAIHGAAASLDSVRRSGLGGVVSGAACLQVNRGFCPCKTEERKDGDRKKERERGKEWVKKRRTVREKKGKCAGRRRMRRRRS